MANGFGTGSGWVATGRRGKGMNCRGRGRGAGMRQGLNFLHGGRSHTRSAIPQCDNNKLESLDAEVLHTVRHVNVGISGKDTAYTAKRNEQNGNTVIMQEPETISPAAKPVVDEKKCISCGLCIDICPQKAIFMSDVAKINPRKCIACGACADECPNEAISFAFGSDDSSIPLMPRR